MAVSAQGQRDRVTALAEELVRLKVDVILTGSASDTRGTKAATTTIPIVMTNDGDPVGNGFVASLARPGGNITGLSTLSPELAGKRLDLLKEIVSKLSRLAVFGTSTSASNAQELKEVEGAVGSQRYRASISWRGQRTGGRGPLAGIGWHRNCGPSPGCGAEFKKPVADDLLQSKSRGSRRADVLRG